MTMMLCTTEHESLLSLEDYDAKFEAGALLIRDAALGWARHGLTGAEIGRRGRSLGAKVADRTARKWLQQFRAEGLLPEAEPSRTTKWRHQQDVSNGKNGRMKQESPIEVIDAEIIEDPDMENVSVESFFAEDYATTTSLATTTDVQPHPLLVHQSWDCDQSITDAANRAQNLIEEALWLCKEYSGKSLKGNFLPEQWQSIQGTADSVRALCSAQRNYKPGPQSDRSANI